MKSLNRLIPLLALTLTAGCLTTGCVGTTPKQRADILCSGARSAALVGSYAAITPPIGRPENRPIIQAASDGISLFVTRTNSNPQEFYDDLKAADPHLGSPVYQLLASQLASLYEMYYDWCVAPATNQTWLYALQFFSAVQQGFDATLGSVPAPTFAPLPVVRPIPSDVALRLRQGVSPKPKFFPVQ
jgi:hypothetical protein